MTTCYAQNKNIQHFEYKQNASDKDWQGKFNLVEKDNKFEIWALGVPLKYRRKGYATQMLLEFISQFNFSKPLSLYVLKGNKIAIHLYQKVGFVIVGDYERDKCAYEMQFQLRKECKAND